jgi:uncharacterized MAPEG superfamily protein
MSSLVIALLVLVLIPYVVRVPLIKALLASEGYDNHHPRVQQQHLTGIAARANAAHYNSFEALQLFLAALAANMLMGRVESQWLVGLAWGFVLCRVLFCWAYLADRDVLRSSIWTLGVACIIAMFVHALL